jgi:hypothetical protein
MTIRKISPVDLRQVKYPAEDVLSTFAERHDREIKLRSAMAYTNKEHDPVWIIVKLDSGELVEIDSTLIDLEDDYVELHGGFALPITAIYDVGV